MSRAMWRRGSCKQQYRRGQQLPLYFEREDMNHLIEVRRVRGRELLFRQWGGKRSKRPLQ
jgi:hypothetical protein